MPNVRTGVESREVPSNLDVNTDAGFNAALAGLAGVEITEDAQRALDALEERNTSVAAGLTTEESVRPPQPRDASGRFAPAATEPEQEEPEGAAPAVEEGGEQEDPWGSVPQELREEFERVRQERDHAQTLIGRQSAEVGEVRQQMAELRGRLDAVMQTQAQAPPAPAPFVDERTVEAVETAVAERGGPAVMQWALDARPDLEEIVLDAWYTVDERGARRFEARREAAQMLMAQQEQQPQQAAQPDPILADLRRERQMGATLQQVRSQVESGAFAAAGIQPGEWGAIKDQLVPALEAAPGFIQNAVVSDDPNTQFEGMKALVQLARGRAVAAATAQATNQRTEQAKQAKQVAQVATGSLRPVQERKPEDNTPESREERIKRFHEQLLRTETTSVRDGLTFGSR